MSSRNCRYKPEWIADLFHLAPIIASGIIWFSSNVGMSLLLNKIFATVLMSASSKRITLNLSTLIEFAFFVTLPRDL